MNLVEVVHRTTYRYAAPVALGEHQLMVRPLAGEDTRILDARLWVSPAARIVRSRDPFGNAVETATFEGRHHELGIVSAFRVLHRPRTLDDIDEAVWSAPRLPGEAAAAAAAAPAATRRCQDPAGVVDSWARDAVAGADGPDLLDRMIAMTARIHQGFRYARRDAMGTQDPLVTLDTRSGTCRDFAWLMIEAARSLGLPARFVSGYLYDTPPEDGHEEPMVGGASTHAWAQVRLPGAGWVDFDPTNDLVGGRNLVRSSVVLEPSQAVPVAGSFTGYARDFLGLTVDVSVGASAFRPGTAPAAPEAALRDLAAPAPA